MSTSNTSLKNIVFTSIYWIFQFIAAFIVRMHLIVMNLAMGKKVSLEFTPATCENHFATNCVLCLTILFDASYIIMIICKVGQFSRTICHEQGVFLLYCGLHLLASLDLNTSHKFKESSKNATLALFSRVGGECDYSTTLEVGTIPS